MQWNIIVLHWRKERIALSQTEITLTSRRIKRICPPRRVLLFLTLPIEVNWKLILFCCACISPVSFYFLRAAVSQSECPSFLNLACKQPQGQSHTSLLGIISKSTQDRGSDPSKTTEFPLVKSYLWWMFSRGVDTSAPISRWKTYLAVVKKLYKPFVDILWCAADDWIENESF